MISRAPSDVAAGQIKREIPFGILRKKMYVYTTCNDTVGGRRCEMWRDKNGSPGLGGGCDGALLPPDAASTSMASAAALAVHDGRARFTDDRIPETTKVIPRDGFIYCILYSERSERPTGFTTMFISFPFFLETIFRVINVVRKLRRYRSVIGRR